MTRPRSSTSGLLAATINDVAARAGVSKRTVTRVMNDEPYVTAHTRGRVLSAVERLGYRPDPAARRLASGKSQIIGLFHSSGIAPDAALIQTVALAVARARYRLLVCSGDDRTASTPEEVEFLVRDLPIDGAIVWPPLSERSAFSQGFQRQGIPCVRIGSAADGDASRQMTRYLLSLGHRRIGFVCGPASHDSVQQRLHGFRDAMDAARADAPIVVYEEDTFDAGARCARQLLIDINRRPSAIFASSDVMAAGVLMTAHELGLDVPGRLSVAGFGDQPISRQVWPTLTTIRLPMGALAERAAATLLDLLRSAEREMVGEPELVAELVPRSSTGRLAEPNFTHSASPHR